MFPNYISGIVQVGNLQLGGHHPIRVQSMTNTDTNNIDATISQCIRLVNAGCEMVRITAQGITEANNLALIKIGLKQKGIDIPLIADIHYNPRAAEVAAGIVEKVRINPGNYSDKHSPGLVLTEKAYNEELERVADRLRPLLQICLQNGTAIRIGTNHGSLSSRIMDRYGDTPEGMVESALEFGRICLGEGFRNLVFSMKSSNVKVMVQSTRLLVQKMQSEGMNFPVHLGVTEAGDGEDGIIKSAAGIGALLEEGIGDTIRVSLTGAPEPEIPVALAITRRYNSFRNLPGIDKRISLATGDLKKRETLAVSGIGGNYPVSVLREVSGKLYHVDEKFQATEPVSGYYSDQFFIAEGNSAEMKKQILPVIRAGTKPVILKNSYHSGNLRHFQVDSAIDFGSLLIEGIGDAIWPDAPEINPEAVSKAAYAILQATRARITSTEFISCPSCGRTLFDIEKILQEVKEATQHLKGLKIAVMGCIVNGPGEMADADYGYVGAGQGKVTLYKRKNIAHKNIPQENAIYMLTELIKESGDWKEK
jgi:(E)-4-hydroxy-3-methylbut-2-enyl-diphosphate synthase